jgi:hypothetical protein
VLGYNGFQIYRGFDLIGENPYSPATVGSWYGSSVGIIENPLTNPKLIATTRPIPMGLGVDLSLSSDDKFLTASYPGISGIFVFDVDEIRRTVDFPELFFVDRNTDSGSNYPAYKFPTNTRIGLKIPLSANQGDFSTIPIDDINPAIDIAARYEVTKLVEEFQSLFNKDTFVVKDIDYGVPSDQQRNAPIGRNGNPRSVLTTARRDWIESLQIENVNSDPSQNPSVSDLTPKFTWNFDTSIIKDINSLSEVKLYISTHDISEGLTAGDWKPIPIDGQIIPTRDDYNPNRILTVTWNNKDGAWTSNNGQVILASNGASFTDFRGFELPQDRMLTAGQQYFWSVEASTTTGFKDEAKGTFRTQLPSPVMNPAETFQSVTVLTHDTAGTVPADLIQAAYSIASDNLDQNQQGLVLKYDPLTQYWVPIKRDGSPISDSLDPSQI